MEPNSAAKRLAYILKTYSNQPWVVAETASVVAMAIGVDRFEQWIDSDETPDLLLGQAVKFIRQTIPRQFRLVTQEQAGGGWETTEEDLGFQQIIEHLFDLAMPLDAMYAKTKVPLNEDWNREAARFLVELLSSTPKGKADHAVDAIIPWIAQQISKLYKARKEHHINSEHVVMLIDELHKKSNAIAAWAKAERKDIGKVTLAEALEGANDFEVIKTVPQGEIAHRFDDGYTMQMLRTKEQLEEEGEVMQHCVGSYYENLQKGKAIIFSLRDDKGRPHVTIEWDPDREQTGDLPIQELSSAEFLRSGLQAFGTFAQIMGKQNEPPAEKYRPYVQEFIRKHFDGDPQGMLLAGADIYELNLKNRVYNQVEFDNLEIPNTDWSGSTFKSVTFDQSNLEGAKFHNCVFTAGTTLFQQANLKKAEFNGSVMRAEKSRWISTTHKGYLNFVEANLQQASFDRVNFVTADFTFTDLGGASLEEAELIDCNFTGADLGGASFDRSNILGMRYDHEITDDPIKRTRHGDLVIDRNTSFKDTKGVPNEIRAFLKEQEEGPQQSLDDDFA